MDTGRLMDRYGARFRGNQQAQLARELIGELVLTHAMRLSDQQAGVVSDFDYDAEVQRIQGLINEAVLAAAQQEIEAGENAA